MEKKIEPDQTNKDMKRKKEHRNELRNMIENLQKMTALRLNTSTHNKYK